MAATCTGSVTTVIERRTIRRREWQRAWRAKHPTYYRDWQRVKRSDPVVRRREIAAVRDWQRRHPVRNALNEYRARAARKGITFTLGAMVFESIVTSDCFYCGKVAAPIHGIDRVNNANGYVTGNVVTACGQCNYSKNDYSVQEFESWICRVWNRINQRRSI